MPRTRLACSSSDREAIDEALVAGEPLRNIATRGRNCKESRKKLAVDDGFEARLVPDEEGTASHLDKPPSAEIGEQARYGLAGRADHLGNFLVGEGELGAHLAVFFRIVGGPFQKEARELLAGGMREADGAHFGDGSLIGFTELLGNAESGLAIVLQETKEFIAGDEFGLNGFDDDCGELITCAGDRGGQAEDLAGIGNAQNEGFAVGGRGRKLDAAAAENENAASRLGFDKERSALGIFCGRSDCGQGLHGRFGQIAKDPLFPVGTTDTVLDDSEAVGSWHS